MGHDEYQGIISEMLSMKSQCHAFIRFVEKENGTQSNIFSSDSTRQHYTGTISYHLSLVVLRRYRPYFVIKYQMLDHRIRRSYNFILGGGKTNKFNNIQRQLFF